VARLSEIKGAAREIERKGGFSELAGTTGGVLPGIYGPLIVVKFSPSATAGP
jgi:hypothetical protein